MKLTQAMSQKQKPSNRNIAKANQEKGNVFQHHHQITSQNQNQTIQKQTNMALTKGFRIFIKEEKNKWAFPDEKPAYNYTLFKEHIRDDDIKENFLAETPLPINLYKGKQVDNFIVSILGRRNQCTVSYSNQE